MEWVKHHWLVGTTLASAALVAVSLVLNVLAVQQLVVPSPGGQPIGWQWIALGSFVVFVGLVWRDRSTTIRQAKKERQRLEKELDQQRVALQAEIDRLGATKAQLEFRFDRSSRYEKADQRAFNVGVYNSGPATAKNVRCRLKISPSPAPALAETNRLRWEQLGPGADIHKDEEEVVSVLQGGVSTSNNVDTLSIQFWLDQGLPAGFAWTDNTEYQIELTALAENAEAISEVFSLRRDGMNVLFYPATKR